MSAQWIVRPPLLIPWFHREWIGPSLMVGGGSISMEREEWWWVLIWLRWSRVKVTSEGHERSELWSRAKRVTVVFNDTPMEEGSGVFFLTAHFVIPVSSLTPMEEGSGVFFLTLLTSSSLWPHSLRHPCVLTHFVIPVFSHPWLVFSPISSLSLTSLSSHLTQVIPDYSLPSLVLPCSLIPACSHITSTTTHSHECSHTECSHTHRHPWLLTHTTRLTLTHSSPRSLSPHFSECSHPSLVFSHSPSHIECHHTHSHILLTCVTTLSDLTSLVFWESVCSHFHGVVLPPSVLSHCLLSHTLSHSCHPCQHFHGVVLPPSLPTHSHTVFSLTHTSMVSYYHQVITHPHQSLCSHSLPSTMSSHTLLPSLHFTSFSPPTHPNSSPTLSHPSCLHHIIITSYHLSPPITTNRFLSLHTTLLTPPFHSQPSQSSPKSSPISIHTHSSPRRTP